MARTLVIDSIEAAGRKFSSGEELVIAPVLKKFMVHFRRSSGYVGEYGFDWLRDEYIHPILNVETDHDGNPHNAPLELSHDLPAIKNEYKSKDITNVLSPYGKEYYPAWLTMYPDTPESQASHGNLIQTFGISLNLEIEELEPLVIDSTELIFEPNNSNLKIKLKNPNLYLRDIIKDIPKEIKWNDTVQKRVYTAPYSLQIRCKGNLDKHEEIKVFAELNGQKEEVGKLMVCKNDDYNENTIDVYLIKSFINDDKNFGETTVDTELAKIGGLSGLEDYLNTLSLNQALIKVKIIPLENWVFSTATLKNVSNGINPMTGLSDPSYQKFLGMIVDLKTMKMDTAKYMNYIDFRFSAKYNTLRNKKALFLYLTPFLSNIAGGASYNIPLDNKHIIIFKNNIDHHSSYAHEIGHTLGLEHSFEKDASKNNSILIAEEEARIANYQIELEKEKAAKIKHLRDNHNYYESNPEHKRKNTKILNSNIEVWKKNIQNRRDSIEVINKNLFQFSIKQTENIMDYNLSNQKVFFKWQSEVMREEVRKYYH